jgi:hypothetical protein
MLRRRIPTAPAPGEKPPAAFDALLAIEYSKDA